METDMLLMDAWREKSNIAYRELLLAYKAPGLFTQERIGQLKNDLRIAEKNFNFWRGSE